MTVAGLFVALITALTNLFMESLPLPSHIHYELLLQLLERQTLPHTDQNPALQEQTRQLIITLRKAIAQQKQIESMCEQSHCSIDYRWSLNPNSTIINSE